MATNKAHDAGRHYASPCLIIALPLADTSMNAGTGADGLQGEARPQRIELAEL
jgi:hypothetical protein